MTARKAVRKEKVAIAEGRKPDRPVVSVPKIGPKAVGSRAHHPKVLAPVGAATVEKGVMIRKCVGFTSMVLAIEVHAISTTQDSTPNTNRIC